MLKLSLKTETAIVKRRALNNIGFYVLLILSYNIVISFHNFVSFDVIVNYHSVKPDIKMCLSIN